MFVANDSGGCWKTHARHRRCSRLPTGNIAPYTHGAILYLFVVFQEVEDMLAQNEFTAEDEEDIMAELEDIISQVWALFF